MLEMTRYGQVWLMRCDCGREHAHGLASLRARVKAGTIPMCRICAQAERDARDPSERRTIARRMLARQFGREALIMGEGPIDPDDELDHIARSDRGP